MFQSLAFYVINAIPQKSVTPSFVETASKYWNPTELLIFENLVGGSTLPRRKGGLCYEIMINFKKIAKQIKTCS